MIDLLLLTLLFSVPPQSPEGWKGIVPLVITRSEAEKIVGVRTDCPAISTPEMENKSAGSIALSIRATVGNNRTWQRATYRGLTMGKSKVTDMRRIFGKPTRVERFDEDKSDPEVWYHYDGVWEFPGTLRFIVDKSRIIRRVDLLPTQLTKEDAIKHFGPDYIETRYDFDLCLGSEEAAPLFESPTGAVINIEYRQRGIAFGVNAYGNIDTISFVSGPVGAESSKCK